MKAYRVVGKFPNGKTIQPFLQDIMANDEEDAKHRLFSTLGSRHRVTRRSITIDSIEQIDPSISKEAKVISAFRNDREIPSQVVTETTSSEEE
tara:strand:- start:542 stop:820 length:279 start_codon:yes stop_codon:yes gene_type:complete